MQLEWREVGGGQLPQSRYGLQAAMVDKVLYIAGGYDSSTLKTLSSILSWDPASESWQAAGDLKVGRVLFAAVAIPPSTIIELECAAKP